MTLATPRRRAARPASPKAHAATADATVPAAEATPRVTRGSRGRPSSAAREAAVDPVADILAVATREFAAKGLAGARVDEIAEQTRTSKRMIYYHFESKEGLYLAVLEAAYRRIRDVEQTLVLDGLGARAALQRLVEFAFDYHLAHPEFVRLVMGENILQGVHLAKSSTITEISQKAIDRLKPVLAQGVAEGVFREGIDPIELHMSISALCFFTVANRHTFGLGFQRDLSRPKALARRKAHIVHMVWREVQAGRDEVV